MQDVPTHPDDVTPAWMDRALRAAGALQGGRVCALRAVQIGADAGFVSHLARFELEYDHDGLDAPTSVVGKFSSLDGQLRLPSGSFAEHEALFYAGLANQPHTLTPRCFYSAVDHDTGRGMQLIEDLSPLRRPDLVAGCKPAEVERVVQALARMHHAWWEAPQLKQASWLPTFETYSEYPIPHLWEHYPRALAQLLPDVQLSPALRACGDLLATDPARILRPLAEAPQTLLHRDIHADNFFLGVTAEDPPVVLFDWELVARGRGPVDLSYFLASSVEVEVRRQIEEEILRGYHASLVDLGVIGYSFKQCWRDYCLGIAGKLIITLYATVLFDNTSPRRRAWRREDLRRLEAFLADHQVVESCLGPS